jgi:hypothetical protein
VKKKQRKTDHFDVYFEVKLFRYTAQTVRYESHFLAFPSAYYHFPATDPPNAPNASGGKGNDGVLEARLVGETPIDMSLDFPPNVTEELCQAALPPLVVGPAFSSRSTPHPLLFGGRK